jgi:hypothetical protein
MNRQTVKAWWWCAPPVLLVVATTLVFVATALRSSEAAGVGPDIALGTPSGNQVPVNAVTTATSPYRGFNLHIHANVGAGVNLTSIAPSNVGTVISVAGDSSDVYCVSAQAVPDMVYGCVGLAQQAITSGGLLATFTFNATGNGCIRAHLVDVPATIADPILDTYTIDSNTSSAQSNAVSLTPVNILIGSGTADDCAGVATATPTSTRTSTSTPPSSTPTSTSTAAAGVGPDIALGTPSGNQVPVNAVTTATSPYRGFNLHIHADVGAGVNLVSIAPSNVGTVISVAGDSSDIFCASAQAVPDKVYGCAGIADQAITTGGLLATFVFNATGNGCIQARLVDVPVNTSVDLVLDTYTVDSNTATAQSNVVSQTPVNVLIGSGTADDCAGVATSTPTSTPTVTVTATPCAAECPTPTATNTPSDGGYPPPTGNCAVAIKARRSSESRRPSPSRYVTPPERSWQARLSISRSCYSPELTPT